MSNTTEANTNSVISTMRDPGTERALLGTIVKNGKDAFFDVDGIVTEDDFCLPINKAIYKTIRSLIEDGIGAFDTATIKMKGKTLGFTNLFGDRKNSEYLDIIDHAVFDPKNLQQFALQIRKYSVVRGLCDGYGSALGYLSKITGSEPLSEIVSRAEEEILKISAGVDQSGSPEVISKDIAARVEQLLASEPVDQVGIPTGFPLFDEAIGGGPRPGTVTVIGARPKTGKTFMAMNIARNVAKRGIPVLYLDTEMTHDYQQSRMMSIDSGCPIGDFETGKFKYDKEIVDAVRNSVKSIEDMPLYYQSIAGMSHTEAMMLARRWIIKTVGLNDRGEANPCLIVYDYMKLTSSNGLTHHTPEYILLGLMLTEMHNFSVKFKIPIVGFVQLNRAGIDAEDASVIAGSDRIMWLASSFSILKNKDENDVCLGCGWEYGNKKLLVVETRHGSGLEQDGDYINLHCSLRPMVGRETANGLIREGFRFSDVVSNTAVHTNVANGSGKASERPANANPGSRQ